jgi:hypothetical protein
MNLGSALKWGAIGLVADFCAPFLTGGLGGVGGFVAGLFQPNARDFDRAYDSGRFGRSWSAPSASGWDIAKTAALTFGALTILPQLIFGAPLYSPRNALLMTGALPLAWSNGLIPNWGWTAGWLT